MKGTKVLRYLQTVIILSALSLIAAGCASYKTVSHEKSNKQIKTAFVMPFEGGGPTECRQKVREAVEAQLVKKGLVITTDYPDVIVEGEITEWSGWFDKKNFWNTGTIRERRIISMVVSARTQDDIILTSIKFDQGANKQALDSSTSGESPERIGSKMGKRLADKLMKKSLLSWVFEKLRVSEPNSMSERWWK